LKDANLVGGCLGVDGIRAGAALEDAGGGAGSDGLLRRTALAGVISDSTVAGSGSSGNAGLSAGRDLGDLLRNGLRVGHGGEQRSDDSA